MLWYVNWGAFVDYVTLLIECSIKPALDWF